MKKLIVLVALTLVSSIACAASLPPTQGNIDKAKATPSDASNVAKLGDRPSGSDADKPGDVVNYVDPVKGTWYQYGSSLTPAEAWDAQVGGGGGE